MQCTLPSNVKVAVLAFKNAQMFALHLQPLAIALPEVAARLGNLYIIICSSGMLSRRALL